VDKRQLETAEEHEAAQSAIELASLRRQADEIFDAAYRQAAEAPDEKAAQSILDKAVQAASGLKSENVRVQNAFSEHLEGSLAGQEERFANQANEIRRKNLFEKSEQTIQFHIEKGGLENAATEIALQSKAFPELSAKNEQRIADLPATSVFVRAAKQIDSDDPRQIQEGIDALEGMDAVGLRGELVEQRHKLLSAGQQQLAFLQKENYDAAIAQIDELATLEDASPAERLRRNAELRQSIMDQVSSDRISGVQGRTALNYLRTLENQWRQPQQHADPVLLYEAYDRILGTNREMTEDQWQENVEWFRTNMAGLGMEAGTLYKQLHEQHNASDSGTGTFVRRVAVERGLDSAEETLLGRVVLDRMREAQEATGKAPSPQEVYGMVTEAAVAIQAGKETRREVYTSAHVQNVFADLRIGGRIVPGDPLGGVKLWQDDEESKAWEKAVAHALVNLEGDEANLLRAMTIIKQKYPEAEIEPGKVSVPWTSLPEETKKRDFEALAKAKVTGGLIWKSYEPVGGWTQEQIAKAHESGMTPEKFGTWLREKGMVRMVPSARKAAAVPAAPALLPVRCSTRAEVEALAPGTHYIWAKDGEERKKL